MIKNYGSDNTNSRLVHKLDKSVEVKRSELRKGLTQRQRLFILGKLSGLNDKDSALAAGYSLSVAENTKQRIWKLRVRNEWSDSEAKLPIGIFKRGLRRRRPRSNGRQYLAVVKIRSYAMANREMRQA